MRVDALLYEPANYTTDRNAAVYEPLGIRWWYLYGRSFAQHSADGGVEGVAERGFFARLRFARWFVKSHDVLIVNGYSNGTNLMVFLWNLWYRRPVGIDSDTPLHVPSRRLARWGKALYLRFLFRRRWCYGLAGGTGAHKELFRYYGMPERRICLSPMMVDNAKFRMSVPRQRGKVFRFLYVGRIVECKNLGVMLEAFKRDFADRGDVELVVVGEGKERARYEAEYAGVPGLRFAGKKVGAELVAQYHAADALVLPSSYEPWGLVVNEAMAAGLPVLVSDRVRTRDLSFNTIVCPICRTRCSACIMMLCFGRSSRTMLRE